MSGVTDMARFKSGVSYYTFATVRISFPENMVCCQFCPLLETYARKQCRRTGEYIADDRGIGYMCPLRFEEVNNDDVSQS